MEGIESCHNPGMDPTEWLPVTKVYRPQDGQIQIHQERLTPWPDCIVSGYYWYGRQCHSPGQVPKWIRDLGSERDATDKG